MIEKLKIHDGDTPGKTFEVKQEYPKPKVTTMNNELKCPFCQDYLIPCVQNQNDWLYHCDNQKCPMYDDADIENAKHPLASKDLWQELIRTRKALDVAIRGLDQMTWGCDSTDAEHLLKEIKIITTLEQKDVK